MSPIILLIEEEQMLRNDLCEMLEAEEFNVIGAEDGLVGLQLAKHLHPDLILCDINMPNLNGYGLLHIIREDASLKNTPFIFLTSKSDQGNSSQSMDLSDNDYVNKKGSYTQFMQAIARKLDAVYC
ncbi:MAG: response regulator [Hormoscilla sp.]